MDRNEVGKFAQDSRWTFFRFLPLFIGIVVTLFVLSFALKSLGLIGKTAVDREVFEQSYQRSEAIKSQISIDEAVLAEINQKLLNPSLDEDTRFNLKAQASAARIRIASARSKQ